MTDTPRYLDGFLAAIHPAQNGTVGEPSPVISHPGTNLSPEEQIKHRLHPLDSFARLLDCAENDRPPAPDDRFRFQWFGLFYQAPRQDAFVLRLRLPGGRLEAFQLAALADITQQLAGGHLLLNTQGGLDIPSVPIRAAAEILRRVESIGLCARQTGGDCVQSVRGGEDDGLADDDPRAPIYPFVGVLEQALQHRRDLANLPRGCEIVFRREDELPRTNQEGETDTIIFQMMSVPPSRPNDAGNGQGSAFLLVIPGDKEGGFLLPPTRVVPDCLRLLETWTANADRTDRQRAGMAGFCHAFGRTRIAALLGNAPWQLRPTQQRVCSSFVEANLPPGFAISGGRLLSGQLSLIGKIVQEYNLSGLRFIDGRLRTVRAVDDAAKAAIDSALTAFA